MAQRIDVLKNGLKIVQNDKAFCFGVDAVLLAAFAEVRKNQKVIDLGCGNGILPLLLGSKKLPVKNEEKTMFELGTTFTGLEIQTGAVQMAREGIKLNGLEDKISIVEGDIKKVKEVLEPQSAEVVVSNPPYMTVNQSSKNSTDEKSIARHEVLCDVNDVIKAAAYLLKSNGAFYMIHRPYRLGEIFSALEKNKLTPRRMQLVYPKVDQAPEMVLIEARPNYKQDIKISPPLIMYGGDNEYTEQMKALF